MSLEHVPFLVLQTVASYLDIDTRYAFSACSLQILDAVDTDNVWHLDEPALQSIERFAPRIEAQLPRYGTEARWNSPEERERRFKRVEAMLRRRLPPALRCATSGAHERFRVLAVYNAIPRTLLFVESADASAADSSGAGDGYMSASRLHNPFKFLFGSFGPAHSDRDLVDQADDVFSPAMVRAAFAGIADRQEAAATAAAAKSSSSEGMMSRNSSATASQLLQAQTPPPPRTEYKWLQRWCIEINRHAHELMRGVASLDELRTVVQIAGIANVANLALYLYISTVFGISRNLVRTIEFFDWTRAYFCRYIAEARLQMVNFGEFRHFPRLDREGRRAAAEGLREFFVIQRGRKPEQQVELRKFALRGLLGRVKVDELMGPDFPSAAEAENALLLRAASGNEAVTAPPAAGVGLASWVNQDKLVAAVEEAAVGSVSVLVNPRLSGAGQGIPALPLWSVLSSCIITGAAAASLGGRAPSLFGVPPEFAARVNLKYKMLFDVLRAAAQHNVDALLFLIFDRICFVIDAVPAIVVGALTQSRPARLGRAAVDSVLATTARFFVPRAARDWASVGAAALTAARTRFVTDPLRRFLLHPLAVARDRTLDALFGQMNAPAIMSFLASTALSVTVTVATESHRPSWARTVKRAGFGEPQAMLAHALYAASLTVLRYRLYTAGMSFWKVTAIESAVRIGTTILEAAFARVAYRKQQRASAAAFSERHGRDDLDDEY